METPDVFSIVTFKNSHYYTPLYHPEIGIMAISELDVAVKEEPNN
jgi:hypothetical protein